MKQFCIFISKIQKFFKRIFTKNLKQNHVCHREAELENIHNSIEKLHSDFNQRLDKIEKFDNLSPIEKLSEKDYVILCAMGPEALD